MLGKGGMVHHRGQTYKMCHGDKLPTCGQYQSQSLPSSLQREGGKYHTFSCRDELIIDQTGRIVNPLHPSAVIKPFSQTGELASLSQRKAKRENDMKKIADLKTNIVCFTFPSLSFCYPLPRAYPCHNFLSPPSTPGQRIITAAVFIGMT